MAMFIKRNYNMRKSILRKYIKKFPNFPFSTVKRKIRKVEIDIEFI